MKKFTPIMLISLILAIVIIFSCDNKTEQVDGEVLVKEVSTGVYYYKLMTTKGNFVRKMILLQ